MSADGCVSSPNISLLVWRHLMLRNSKVPLASSAICTTHTQWCRSAYANVLMVINYSAIVQECVILCTRHGRHVHGWRSAGGWQALQNYSSAYYTLLTYPSSSQWYEKWHCKINFHIFPHTIYEPGYEHNVQWINFYRVLHPFLITNDTQKSSTAIHRRSKGPSLWSCTSCKRNSQFPGSICPCLSVVMLCEFIR